MGWKLKVHLCFIDKLPIFEFSLELANGVLLVSFGITLLEINILALDIMRRPLY